jgi:hypothetical protein
MKKLFEKYEELKEEHPDIPLYAGVAILVILILILL